MGSARVERRLRRVARAVRGLLRTYLHTASVDAVNWLHNQSIGRPSNRAERCTHPSRFCRRSRRSRVRWGHNRGSCHGSRHAARAFASPLQKQRLSGFGYREVIRRLRKARFEFDRQAKGSHEIWRIRTPKLAPRCPTTRVIYRKGPFERFSEAQGFPPTSSSGSADWLAVVIPGCKSSRVAGNATAESSPERLWSSALPMRIGDQHGPGPHK
jgi:hypothetical protein